MQWVGPRHISGDDGCLYDTVADTLSGLGWTALTMVRGRHQRGDDPGVLRSTVLHLGADARRWAQWVLADEPFLLGGLPIGWQVSARASAEGMAHWAAYFTREVPGEAVSAFLLALDATEQPTATLGGPDLVVSATTANGWIPDADEPAAAADPMYVSHLSLGEVPPLIQDGDPRSAVPEADGPGLQGWQAWSEPTAGGPYLWAASFSSSVPHDLVAAFAAALSSTAPVLRRRLPESTRDRLLRAPAG
nr:DUF317 domain-containing protein [Streptomyces tardus]